ncbi:MAG: resuscitation-promoting factor, partial [Candidatus Nanopelagicales bacterium]
TEKVLQNGNDGRGVAIYRFVRRDGVVTARTLVDRKVTRHATPRIVAYGTKERPYTPPSTGSSGLNWGALAQCESSGNPQAVNPGGYYGLYQFSLSTWYSVGGTGNPINASSTEQTYRAQVLYERSGSAPWPVCGSLLYS